MKIFCIAYILGVFSGALLFAYFSAPETFDNLFPGSDPEKRAEAAEKAGETVDKIADATAGAIEKGKEKAQEFAESETAQRVAETGKQALATGKDKALALAVMARLKLADDVDSGQIEASAEDGIITLTGLARSVAEAKRAIEIAADTPGVNGVRSQIEAAPSG